MKVVYTKPNTHPTIAAVDADIKGYKVHPNTEMPKKSKKNPLTKTDKQRNQRISSSRVVIENIIRNLKIFRILKYDQRGRFKSQIAALTY
ncbi:MAG: transposase [Bacteroidetes bacterium]|nr:transposase [Bacteroidota bacterium]